MNGIYFVLGVKIDSISEFNNWTFDEFWATNGDVDSDIVEGEHVMMTKLRVFLRFPWVENLKF